MSSAIYSGKQVSVQEDSHHYIVVVDAQPILRCTARREAIRYAVLVRRALRRADLIEASGVAPQRLPDPRKISD